jgi:AP-1 complex subunit beta-1
VENLLDIDFDGAIPASLQGQATSASGLEDLVSRTDSPAIGASGGSNAMDDLMGIFGGQSNAPGAATGGTDDLMNGFGGLDLSGSSSQQQAATQKKTNEDILGLF